MAQTLCIRYHKGLTLGYTVDLAVDDLKDGLLNLVGKMLLVPVEFAFR